MSRAPRSHVAHPRHPLTGRQFRVSARTKGELQALLTHVDSMRIALRLGMKSEDEIDRSLRRLVHGSTTIARAGAAYMAQRDVADNTRKAIASFLRDAGKPLATLEIADLSAGRVQGWLDKLGDRGVSMTTRESYWRRLRSIVRFAAEREWIGRSPWGPWKPTFRGKGRVRLREAARNLGELARMLAAAGDIDAERAARGLVPDLEPKIATAASIGLRQGELAGLRWSDLDVRALTIRVARQWDSDCPPKGKKIKELSASRALFELLARYQDTLAALGLYAPDGPIFPMAKRPGDRGPRAYQKGECLSRGSIRRVVKRAQLPNAKAWSAHSLRDTFATLEERAHDLETLAERTRHASIASLVRYLRGARREGPAPAGFALPERPPLLLPEKATAPKEG